MLATTLLTRSLNQTTAYEFASTQRERLLHALQPAPYLYFHSSSYSSSSALPSHSNPASSALRNNTDAAAVVEELSSGVAHKAGVSTLTVDKFEGRYLLSGGADASISIWDLESPIQHSVSTSTITSSSESASLHAACTYKPLGTASKTDAKSHQYGVTHVSFYAFDSLAFLSSSYDHTLKMYSSETLAASASFDMASVVYSHAMSPIGTHLLVACASQHPAIRLVDLRSGASTHALTGHVGAGVYSVAWSPTDESILMSGGADGSVRFWDVRRSAGLLASLDKEDSVGAGSGAAAAARHGARAHNGAVNGVMWTDDGKHIVTVGHDERIRVWHGFTGANTLANFGPLVRNTAPCALLPCLSPSRAMPRHQDVLLYPNAAEVLMFDLLDGTLIKRLRVPGLSSSTTAATAAATRSARHRTTALAWRPHDVEVLSAHTDGRIRAWRPRTTLDAMLDEQDRAEAEAAGGGGGDARKRKRQVLEDIYRNLMTSTATFS